MRPASPSQDIAQFGGTWKAALTATQPGQQTPHQQLTLARTKKAGIFWLGGETSCFCFPCLTPVRSRSNLVLRHLVTTAARASGGASVIRSMNSNGRHPRMSAAHPVYHWAVGFASVVHRGIIGGSRRFQSARSGRDTQLLTRYCVLLTSTPAPPVEAWLQLFSSSRRPILACV
jgi:hypothetical protein